jgi:hypothetical protein
MGHPRPCVTGCGVDRHRGPFGFAQGRLFDSTLSLAFPNDKVPLRMTGLKRVPISQRADGGVTGKAHCAISVIPTLAQRTRKNGAPSALVVQADKASATRRELSSTRGTELGWTGGDARLSTNKKAPLLRAGL